jgi:hypothetical protein
VEAVIWRETVAAAWLTGEVRAGVAAMARVFFADAKPTLLQTQIALGVYVAENDLNREDISCLRLDIIRRREDGHEFAPSNAAVETEYQLLIHVRDDPQIDVRLYGYPAKQLQKRRKKVRTVVICRGSPSIRHFDNLVYLPKHERLYDERGRPVVDMRPWRKRGREVVPDGNRLPVSLKLKRFQPQVMLCGVADNHWGKFLTDGISRLWPLSEASISEEIELFGPRWPSRAKSEHVARFLRYAGIDADRFVRSKEPMLLSRVLVPEPSFVQMSHAFARHFALAEIVAERICGGIGQTDQPLYLSRSRLPSEVQRLEGEAALEDALRVRGVRIAYPETMSFEDQVRLVNLHSTVIGQLGSALHTVAYTLPNRGKRLFVLEPSAPPHYFGSFVMMDLLKGIQSKYVYVPPVDLSETCCPSQGTRGRVDVKTTIAWLIALSAI